MIDDPDWLAAYREVIEKGRRRVQPPTDADLVALLRDDLPENERERIEERLAYYPEVARVFAETAPPPSEPQPGDDGYVTQEELADRWKAIHSRIHPAERPSAWAARKRAPLTGWLTIAAIITVVALLSGWISSVSEKNRVARALASSQADVQRLTRTLSQRPAIASQILRPDGVRGAEQAPIELASQGDYVRLTLALPKHPSWPEYRAEIATAGSTPRAIWSATGLDLHPDNSIEIVLPGTFLRTGTYIVTAYGVSATGERVLAKYTVHASR